MKKIVVAIVALTVCMTVAAETKASPDAKKADAARIEVSDVDCIKGVVTDKVSKEVLAGVAVEYNGQKTYTDLDGKFSLRKSSNVSDLRLSLISYEDRSLNVTDKNEVNVELRQR